MQGAKHEHTSTVREASFIAGVPLSAVNRAIDESRIPLGLIRKKRKRLLTDKGLFILAVSNELKRRVPEKTQQHLVSDVVRLLKRHRHLGQLGTVEYRKGTLTYVVELKLIARRIEENRRRLEKLMRTVVQDPEIQAGAPTFRGTRILVYPVAQALERGVSEAELQEDYPDLTSRMLEAARIYAKTKPPRGRPRADARGLTALSERRLAG